MDFAKLQQVHLKGGEVVDFLYWIEDGRRFVGIPRTPMADRKTYRTRDIARKYHGVDAKHRRILFASNEPPMAAQ
jgi:hypothetical protein